MCGFVVKVKGRKRRRRRMKRMRSKRIRKRRVKMRSRSISRWRGSGGEIKKVIFVKK